MAAADRRRLAVRAAVATVVLAAAAAAVGDRLQPPGERAAAGALIAAIRLYRASLSPVLAGHGIRCRFEPSCSRYAEDCIAELGAVRGSLLVARRVLRCGPWTAAGTVDPPPRRRPELASWRPDD